MLTLLQGTVSPQAEMLAYETLWSMRSQSLKTLSDRFKQHPVTPSRLLEIDRSEQLNPSDELKHLVRDYVEKISGFSVCLHGSTFYPPQLRDARYPIELFYYKGDIGLTAAPTISIVGTRKCSDAGRKRAARLARELVEANYVIVSGLAEGIDTAAMESAIATPGGHVVGVLGTPITEYYPPENRALQDEVANNHLLISQVPFYRYFTEPFVAHKRYFPERNETMAALSRATVIVEASETSGTHTQARACMNQGRPLFILKSCFDNPSISWPQKYREQGAHMAAHTSDILTVLGTNAAAIVDQN